MINELSEIYTPESFLSREIDLPEVLRLGWDGISLAKYQDETGTLWLPTRSAFDKTTSYDRFGNEKLNMDILEKSEITRSQALELADALWDTEIPLLAIVHKILNHSEIVIPERQDNMLIALAGRSKQGKTQLSAQLALQGVNVISIDAKNELEIRIHKLTTNETLKVEPTVYSQPRSIEETAKIIDNLLLQVASFETGPTVLDCGGYSAQKPRGIYGRDLVTSAADRVIIVSSGQSPIWYGDSFVGEFAETVYKNPGLNHLYMVTMPNRIPMFSDNTGDSQSAKEFSKMYLSQSALDKLYYETQAERNTAAQILEQALYK